MFISMEKLNSNTLTSFGARMIWARERSNLKQNEAAKAAGVSQPTLSGLEKPSAKGSKHTSTFATLYKVRVEWLAKNEGSPDLSESSEMAQKMELLTPHQQKMVENLLDGLVAENQTNKNNQ